MHNSFKLQHGKVTKCQEQHNITTEIKKEGGGRRNYVVLMQERLTLATPFAG